MNTHVVDRVADLLEGRLADAEESRLREHLESCDDCRRDVDFAAQLRELVIAADLRHLRPERIVAVADGEDADPREATHLERCDDCAAEVRELRAIPAPSQERTHRTAGTPAPRRRNLADLRTWIGVAVAAAVVVFALFPGGPDLAGLANLDPLPVRITRIQPEPESFLEAWHAGLEAYGTGDVTTAAAEFALATQRDPRAAEAWLYLGSARLLAGDAAGAERALERCVELEPDPVVLEAAWWWAAQTSLRRGDGVAAAERLERVIALEGDHLERATEQLAQVRR